MTTPNIQTIIGNRPPAGSCKPDGTYRWATRRHEDGLWYIVEYDGWLIVEEHKTTSRAIADLIETAIRSNR